MKELNVEEQIYLCKYHDVDNSLQTTLGISDKKANELIEKYKSNGLYKQYRNLSDEEYEKIIKNEKTKSKFPKTKPKIEISEKVDFIDLENGYVKVPIKTVMEWCYDKGRLDQLLENQAKEAEE